MYKKIFLYYYLIILGVLKCYSNQNEYYTIMIDDNSLLLDNYNFCSKYISFK